MNEIQTNAETEMKDSEQVFSEFCVKEYGKPENVVSEFEKNI
jgi:2-phospho-L-lactate transferase/gluconeogenesis factor (CofD/UPF0052 family)